MSLFVKPGEKIFALSKGSIKLQVELLSYLNIGSFRSHSELRSLLAQMKPSKVGLEPPPVNFLKKTDVATTTTLTTTSYQIDDGDISK